MPPTIQQDSGTLASITGAVGGVAPSALDGNGNVQIFTDNNNSPTYVNLTISGLTATRLVSTDSSKKLSSVTDLTTWVKGTADRITSVNASGVVTLDIAASYVGQATITILGTVATGTWSATTIAVNKGGTGQTSYTDGQLLIGNSTGNTLAKAALTGTTSQVIVTNGAGTITLSLPQNIATGSSPTFAALSITADNTVGGNNIINTAGKTLKVKQGSDACMGTGATMVIGTVTVSTTAVNTGDMVITSRTAEGGTLGSGEPTVTIVDGVSFTLTSSSALDTSTYTWLIIKAA